LGTLRSRCPVHFSGNCVPAVRKVRELSSHAFPLKLSPDYDRLQHINQHQTVQHLIIITSMPQIMASITRTYRSEIYHSCQCYGELCGNMTAATNGGQTRANSCNDMMSSVRIISRRFVPRVEKSTADCNHVQV